MGPICVFGLVSSFFSFSSLWGEGFFVEMRNEENKKRGGERGGGGGMCLGTPLPLGGGVGVGGMRGKTSRKKKERKRKDARERGGGWYILDINPPILPNFLIENTCSNPLLLSLTNLTLAIKVPNRFRERFRHVGVRALKEIEYLVRGDDIGFASAMCFVQAEQSHNVAVVGVEELSVFFGTLVGIHMYFIGS